MAKYGTFKYGTGIKYGASATTATGALTWKLMIDWHATLNGRNDAVNMVALEIRRGRDYYIAPHSDDFEPIRGGTAEIELENRAGIYDPYNTASPLYPHILPGRKVTVSVIENATGT